jgi:hypothetical protein
VLDSLPLNRFNTRSFVQWSPIINAQVAQSVEQGTENPRVGGSIPPLGTINKFNKLTSKYLPLLDISKYTRVTKIRAC